MSEKTRILTGIRPTGPLHLGHYAGALENSRTTVQNLKERYERTGVSSKELKDPLTTVLNELLDPMWERRAKYESNLSLVREALEQGTKCGRAIAQETMEMVRDALDLNYLRNTDVQSRVRVVPSRC